MPKTASAEPAGPVQNAGRLKYADPRDLPSYPSTGLSSDGAAAGAAASLGWANQKSPEPWRPDKSSSASAAAALAKDYKPSDVWEPSSTSAGAKAALLAVDSAGAALKQSRSDKRTSQQEGWGNSAATQAFHANRPTSTEPTNLQSGGSAANQAFQGGALPDDSSPSKSAGQRSLAAAKGAMSSSRQDTSRPSSYAAKDPHSLEASAASSALNGATLAHRNSLMASKPAMEDAGAVPVTTMTRNMFTSNPPVKPEQDEERLHQTAVEMARKMYQAQQKQIEQNKDNDGDSTSSPFAGTPLNLQDAAYKQAQERLAKLHDEHQQSREFQEYYGNTSSPRRKFSVTNKLRHRSTSDTDPDDRVRSDKIREQMSMFSNKLTEVDKNKRAKDREALLAAAQRNVKTRLQGMDEKVYFETGKRNSSMLTDFELKAQQAAQSLHEGRSENKGKIDIGGGRFMTQEEINAIASKRLQPVLDDINEKAETERERLATLKMEEDARREELARQKAREREEKELAKKIKDEEKQEEKTKKQQEKAEEKTRKDEEKAKKAQEKQEEKTRKDEEKAAKAEEQRKHKEEQKAAKEQEKAAKAEQDREAKEEKRRSKMEAAAATTSNEDSAAAEGRESEEPANAERAADSDDDSDDLLDTDDENEVSNERQGEHKRESQDAASASATGGDAESSKRKSVEGSTSSSKSKSGVKGWIKNRFSRGKSVSEKPEKEGGEKRRSFFGGKGHKSDKSNTSIDNRSSSIRDVAMAGKGEDSKDDDAWDKDVAATKKNADEEDAAVGGEQSEAKEKEEQKEEEEEKADSRGVSPVSTPAGEDKTERESRGLEPPKAPLDDSAARISSSPTRDSRFKEEMDQ